MQTVKYILLIGIYSILSQGCATTPPSGRQTDPTRLTDLGNGICQEDNGRMWQVERTEVFSSGQEARNYVHNLELGNFNDWRLPSKEELYELCYLLELRLAGDCPIKLKGSYWLANGSDTDAGEWESYPLCGGPGFRYFKGKTGRVKGVRP